METQVVYWSTWTSPDREPLMNLILDTPKQFLSTLPPETDDKANSYRRCYASKNSFGNYFVITNPFDTEAEVGGLPDQPVLRQDRDLFFLNRPAFKNVHTLEYDFKWVFFSEQPVELELVHPYMHKTESSNYGYVASGSYDISKWFRPIGATYNLWENTNNLKLKKDEPLFYVNFKTKNKIILKQFALTPEIKYIAEACLKYKFIVPNQQLKNLYNRFTQGGNNKKLLTLIRQSAID
jgi:hypothetical protein